MLRDLRYALRSLSRARGFTAVAVLTLALGIGSNLAMFTMLRAAILKPLPFRDPSRLVAVWDNFLPQLPKVGSSAAEFEAVKQQTDLIDAATWYRYIATPLNFTEPGADPVELHAAFTATDFFATLGIAPIAGRTFAAQEPPNSVLLSERIWRGRFSANAAAIGGAMTLSGQVYTIAGVIPDNRRFPDWADVWLPPGPLLGDEITNPLRHALAIVARLKPDVTVPQAGARVETAFRRLAADHPKTSTGFGVRMYGFQDDLTAAVRPALLLLSGAVALVLLIVCANVANLLLARAGFRAKEIAVRIALGAGAGQLLRQLLTESLVLSVIGGLAGVAIAIAGLDFAGANATPDWTTTAFALSVTLASALLFGLAPALQLIRNDPQATIKSSSPPSGGSLLRSSLVVVEFALAMMLAAGAGILVKSVARVMNVDPGYDSRGVLALRVSLPAREEPAPVYRRIVERLRELPGVQAVAMANALPLTPGMAFTKRFSVPGSALVNPDALPTAQSRFVSPGYFETLRIPLRAGRTFTDRDLDQDSVIINESMARRFWPGQDPVGRKYLSGPFGPNPTYSTVIGVVGDVKQMGLESASTMDEYFPDATPRFVLLRGSVDAAVLAASARHAIHVAAPDLPISETILLDEVPAQSTRERRWTMTVLGAFAGVALLLAVIGIYGVMSGTVTQRAREIGVRMALGARPRDVSRMVLRRAAALAMLGLVAGVAGALALRQVLAALVFEVSTSDPWIYASGVAVMIAAALIASWLPARRAARMDPLQALRQD
jgi:predicted permease